jgi:hypothetical protein
MRFAAAVAITLALGENDFERAQAIARSTDAERARFHSQYVFLVNSPAVTQIEVLTEFRRAVLVTEDHLKLGDWIFSRSVPSLEEATRPTRGEVAIVAQVRFNPLNVLVSVPDYEVAMGQDTAGRLLAIDTEVVPQYSLPFKTPRGDRTSLVGAMLQARLPAAPIGQSVRPVGVTLDGQELARVSVDFGRLK